MATVWQATVDDLYHAQGKAELVGGEIVHMNPSGDWHGAAAGNIFVSLFTHAKEAGSGRAYPDNVGFLCDLPHRKSFSPDVAYYIGPRGGIRFLPQPPAFAVEIRSPEDYGPAAEERLAEKRADYFSAGTLVVWDVDLVGDETIRVYRTTEPETPVIFRRGETAAAEPAVRGWTMEVDELFR